MRRLSLIPFVIALASGACAHAPDAVPPRAPTEPVGGQKKPAAADPGKSAPESSTFAASSNAFAIDLYRKIAGGRGNVAFSPASITTALEMTWAGAKGETAEQISHVLHLGDDRDAALAAAKATVTAYARPNEAYELLFADKLFGERSYPFDPRFVALSRDTFGAPLEMLDFARKPDASRGTINAFVSTSTKDRIRNLLPEGSIDDSTRLVLVNAVYMKAKWAQPFPKAATAIEPFALAAGKRDVPMMHTEGSFSYGEADGALVLDMPYAGGDLAFTVILPKDAAGLADLEKRLDAGSLERFVGAAKPALVSVTLPKFRVDPTEPVRLKTMLASLGMPLAFDDAADFSGMTRGGQPLKVKDAFHKAFVAVDEGGTEAAAATAVVMMPEMVTAVEPTPIPFRADHPFVFAVRDVRTNLVLFLGRVNDPSA